MLGFHISQILQPIQNRLRMSVRFTPRNPLQTRIQSPPPKGMAAMIERGVGVVNDI